MSETAFSRVVEIQQEALQTAKDLRAGKVDTNMAGKLNGLYRTAANAATQEINEAKVRLDAARLIQQGAEHKNRISKRLKNIQLLKASNPKRLVK